jgi:SM-20-related protein
VNAVVAGLAADGLAIVAQFLPPPAIAALRTEAERHALAGELAPAGIGRGSARIERADIRGDRIRWLDDTAAEPPEQAFRAAVEELRLTVNRVLALGLFEFEGHYALYPPGSAYARHRDRFRDDDARVVSCVLYLNDGWRPTAGGALRLHLGDGRHRDVPPAGGTLVAFLSDRFEHEVLPATGARWSLAGWFRRRSLPGRSAPAQAATDGAVRRAAALRWARHACQEAMPAPAPVTATT